MARVIALMGYTLFDLADRLRNRGWQVPAYTLTGAVSDVAVQRILVRLGVSHDMASLLLDDFRAAVTHFDDQAGVRRIQPPVTHSALRPLLTCSQSRRGNP
jgi:glutamate/tyrosine decarboxylase-like PLP-dependent enzyme